MSEGMNARSNVDQLYKALLSDYCKYSRTEWDGKTLKRINLDDIYCTPRISTRVRSEKLEDLSFPSILEIHLEASRKQCEFREALESLILQRFFPSPISLDGNEQDIPKFLLMASPGAGKTTWCKKVCLACLEETKSSSQLHSLTHLEWSGDQWFPVFLPCRNYTPSNDTEEMFEQIAYCVTTRLFQVKARDTINNYEFASMIDTKAEQGSLLLIIDGIDEMIITQKRISFIRSLSAFLKRYPKSITIITSRPFAEITNTLRDEGVGHNVLLTFLPLTKDNVLSYCKKWHEAVFADDPQLILNYKQVLKQIYSRQFSSTEYMTRTPYLLSNLLRLSIYTGRLPTSILELYNKSFEMMVDWTTKIDAGLEKIDVTIQLAYLAYWMTKNNRLSINRDELMSIIQQCYIELDGFFKTPSNLNRIPEYVEVFTERNCVLESVNDNQFSFPHRQLQEYLTAYAIMNGFSDSEDNAINQMDLLRKKYDCDSTAQINSWEEIVVFCALIGDSRFAHELVMELLKLCRNSSGSKAALYNDYLFSFYTKGVLLSKKDQHAIFDSCFKTQISAKHVSDVCTIVAERSDLSTELVNYVEKRYLEGIEKGDINYAFVQGVIKAKQSAMEDQDPLRVAIKWTMSQDTSTAVMGFSMLDVLAWCKVTNSGQYEFREILPEKELPEISGLLSLSFQNIEKQWFETPELLQVLTSSLRECVLAGFLDADCVQRIISPFLVNELLQATPDATSIHPSVQHILDIWPVPHFDCLPANTLSASSEQQSYWRSCFDEAMSDDNAHDFSPVFLFNTCVAVGVWKTREETLSAFYSILNEKMDKESENGARALQIMKSLGCSMVKVRYDEKELGVRVEVNESISTRSKTNSDFIYALPIRRMTLKGEMPIHLISEKVWINNYGYLLRRKEISCTVVEDGRLTSIDANFFLDPILEDGGAFALINHALSVSGFYINCLGDYSRGLDTLSNSIVGNSHMDDDLQDAFDWWFALAAESETEGLVVLLWLYELGFWPNSNESTPEAQSPETHESISFSKEDVSLLLFFSKEAARSLGEKAYSAYSKLLEELRRADTT